MMQKTKIELPLLKKFYKTVTDEAKEHYRKEWMKYTGKTVQTFHNRIDSPKIVDLALFQFCFDGSDFAPELVTDCVMKEFEPAFNDLSKFKTEE